jgi:hypothetical protein
MQANNTRPYSKLTEAKRLETWLKKYSTCLAKLQALNSNPSTPKERVRESEREEGREHF